MGGLTVSFLRTLLGRSRLSPAAARTPRSPAVEPSQPVRAAAYLRAHTWYRIIGDLDANVCVRVLFSRSPPRLLPVILRAPRFVSRAHSSPCSPVHVSFVRAPSRITRALLLHARTHSTYVGGRCTWSTGYQSTGGRAEGRYFTRRKQPFDAAPTLSPVSAPPRACVRTTTTIDERLCSLANVANVTRQQYLCAHGNTRVVVLR